MRFLFDTCVLSELSKKRPEPNVVSWAEECDEDAVFLSVLTIGKIQKGIIKLKDKKRGAVLQKWLDEDLKKRFEGKILPVDLEVSMTWGHMQGEAEKKGIKIPSIDGLIGATAVANNLTVVTRNVSDISKTGARVINPWTKE